MVPRSILKMLLCAAILLAVITTANAAAPADEAAPATAGSFHTYLMPDLSLKSAFMVPLAPQTETGFKRGTCHCSCGTAPCNTSADCGGNSCDQFISCCVKQPEAQWSQESSRKTEMPAFKGSCN